MFCTECGTKIIEGAKFCYNCGAPVPPAPPEPQDVQNVPLQEVPDASVSPETAPVSTENLTDGKSIDEQIPEPQKPEEPAPEAAPEEVCHVAPPQGPTAVSAPVEGLSAGQLVTMILAGASFLFATISISSANWPFRAVVLIACACLTFIIARGLELPRQIYALPLALFLVASFGDRIVTMIRRLMSHNTAGFSIEGIIYRLALLIALVLLIFIVYSTSGKKKAPTAVFMVLSGLFALYHAYSFISLIKYGRAVVMYNLGMFAFFAAYVLISWRYYKGRAEADESEITQRHYNQVHVESRPEVSVSDNAYAPDAQPAQPVPHPQSLAESIYAPPRPQPDSGDIYCSRCGEKIPADSEYCRKCGYPVR